MWYFRPDSACGSGGGFAGMSAFGLKIKPIISIMTGTKSRLPHISGVRRLLKITEIAGRLCSPPHVVYRVAGDILETHCRIVGAGFAALRGGQAAVRQSEPRGGNHPSAACGAALFTGII